MKKRLIIVLSILLAFMMVGCGKKEQVADTLGGKYVNAFNSSKSSDADSMVNDLLEGVEAPYDLLPIEVEPGYLNGFDTEINGFNKGVMFAPMIGSIPFVGYVFETDNAGALETMLKENANMRWNICTEADEMVSATKNNLVFFMMCTNEDQ